jgi:prepilin-type N-terminal cleavage/methylation domain-containing protein/prepilin-type processing-associated H-X9-DG protein
MRKQKAFTLIELLVVIAIIALLLAIIMPSLRMAKEHAIKITCSANLKSLAMAALFYADEHGGLTPSSSNVWRSPPTGGAFRPGWCGSTGSDAGPDTKEVQMYGIATNLSKGLVNGQLWPYIENFDAWRCPSDPAKEQMRSYCMAGEWWGTSYNETTGTIRYDPGPPKPTVYKRCSDVKNTASMFLFIDEIGYNYDAYFAIYYTQANWWNIPGYLHSGGTVNGFADGHVESYKLESATIEVAKKAFETAMDEILAGKTSSFRMPLNHPTYANSEDLKYYQRATWGSSGW